MGRRPPATAQATHSDTVGVSDRCDAALWQTTASLRASHFHPDAAASSTCCSTVRGSTAELDALIDSFSRSAQSAARCSKRGWWRSGDPRAKTCSMRWSSTFSFDSGARALSIGYRVADGSLDPNYYDLLASEARLTSFVAIAKGDLPTRHWFRLGRDHDARSDIGSALISWSGSMFEYLMPSLVMRAPAGSLLEQTSHVVVRQQMKYGASAACPGVFRNPPTTRAIWNSPINIRALAFRAWPQTRPRRQHRDRTLCDGACGDGRSATRPRAISRVWPTPADAAVWLVRGAGLYAGASSRRPERRHHPRLYGASSGHERGRHRRRASRRRDARSLSCRADDPGDRTPAAGTHAARRGDMRSRGLRAGEAADVREPAFRRRRADSTLRTRSPRARICCPTADMR